MTDHELTWRPTLHLPDAEIHIADAQAALSAQTSWRTTLGAHLYLLAGRETAHGQIAAYIGLSHSVLTHRPWVSLTQWVRTQRALEMESIALVRFRDEPQLDALKILEARIIRGTNAAGIYTHNTLSSAPAASRALGATGEHVAAYGDFLERVLRHHIFAGRTNPLMTPTGSLRESAVRTVLSARRAIDTDEVLARLEKMNVSYGGNTVGATARRDLTVREVGTAGAPRVRSTHVGRKAVYYPRYLPQALAVQRYTTVQSRRCPA